MDVPIYNTCQFTEKSSDLKAVIENSNQYLKKYKLNDNSNTILQASETSKLHEKYLKMLLLLSHFFI